MTNKSSFYRKISLIIPAYNCSNELEKHLARIAPILKYFGEIIAVDSYSTDGTYEILIRELEKYNAIIYQRERGLYASWNDAISKTSLEYCYISTIGDLPDLMRLEDFFDTAIKSNADISISPPMVLKENRLGLCLNDWSIHKILNQFNLQTPIVLEKELIHGLTTYCLLNDCFASLSGSFASNLSKTHILKDNPFPINYEGIGDVVWWSRLSHKVSTLIYPYKVSEFVHHKKSYKAMSIKQTRYFISEITRTLKLNPNDKTVYEKYLSRVIKNKELIIKYKFLRLLMPIRYYNKFKMRNISRSVKKIIDRIEQELSTKLMHAQKLNLTNKS